MFFENMKGKHFDKFRNVIFNVNFLIIVFLY